MVTFFYTGYPGIDWENRDTILTDIAILADREEEIDGYNDVVPILRYIQYRRIIPSVSLTQTYVESSNSVNSVTFNESLDWYFIEPSPVDMPHFLPMLFKESMEHTLENLVVSIGSAQEFNWRAYNTMQEAYLSLINAYLKDRNIQSYVYGFTKQWVASY